MRIESLRVEGFKNLEDVEVEFDADSPFVVFVGANGSGKSNLLEALAAIFQHLDLDLPAPFGYALSYECRGTFIRIDASRDAVPKFYSRPASDAAWKPLARRDFLGEDKNGPLYRPAFVFGYYSGSSDRLAPYFARHQERYYDYLINVRKRKQDIADPTTLRRLFAAETLYGQFALMSFFMEPGEEAEADRAFLRDHLHIEELDSVLFALHKPPWPKRAEGDSRFWGAQGEVATFLGRLMDEASLPMRASRRVGGASLRPTRLEHLFLYLRDGEALERVYAHYGSQYKFFTALESMHLSRLLAEVRTRVRLSSLGPGESLTYRDLSEGEQQLLLVLGLLKFTARSEALFLLDEPDTHLNPAWSVRYLEFLARFMIDRESCHVMMATHDPLVFASLERDQVRIVISGENGRALIQPPDGDPRGMGIQAILASDLFGLPAGGLDEPTLRDLELQQRLAAKEGVLTASERDALEEVNRRLEGLDFWKRDRDPLYTLFREKFIPEWLRVAGPLPEDRVLSAEQIRSRDAAAQEIAAEIAAEAASGESAQ